MVNDFNVLFYSNDDMCVFTQNKVASRLCDFFFHDDGTFQLYYKLSDKEDNIVIESSDISESDSPLFEYRIDPLLVGTNHVEASNPKNIEFIRNTFEEILLKKSKKNIYFFYRHPTLRLISGLYQEFSAFLSERIFLEIWLSKFNDSDTNDILNYISLHGVAAQNFTTDELKQLEELQTPTLYNNLKIMVGDWLKAVGRGSFYSFPHTKNYLNFYTHFILTYGVDMNKIHLIDIDNTDVEDVFSKYKTKEELQNIMPFQRNEEGKIIKENFSDSFLKNIFKEMVFNQSYWKVQKINFYETVSDYIREEIWAYHTLKSFDKNHTNLDDLIENKNII